MNADHVIVEMRGKLDQNIFGKNHPLHEIIEKLIKTGTEIQELNFKIREVETNRRFEIIDRMFNKLWDLKQHIIDKLHVIYSNEFKKVAEISGFKTWWIEIDYDIVEGQSDEVRIYFTDNYRTLLDGDILVKSISCVGFIYPIFDYTIGISFEPHYFTCIYKFSRPISINWILNNTLSLPIPDHNVKLIRTII